MSAQRTQRKTYSAEFKSVEGRYILGQYDGTTMVVYQAYRPAIGRFAATHRYIDNEGELTLWDAASGGRVPIQPDTQPIASVQWSPTGDRLLVARQIEGYHTRDEIWHLDPVPAQTPAGK
jgi:hypothetical protein